MLPDARRCELLVDRADYLPFLPPKKGLDMSKGSLLLFVIGFVMMFVLGLWTGPGCGPGPFAGGATAAEPGPPPVFS